ncbi:hypothetical protein Ancab_020207 [Ancistrocladus abbreviatus]
MEASANSLIACPGKNAWPELVGLRGLEAALIIEAENSYVRAVILPEGTYTTKDFRCNRVWVFVDTLGRVTRVPQVG